MSSGTGRGRNSIARPTRVISPARPNAWTTVSARATSASIRGAPPSGHTRARNTTPRTRFSQELRRNIQRLISPPMWRSTRRRSSGGTPARRAATSGRISLPRTRSEIRRLTPAMTQDATRRPSQKPARSTAARATLVVVEGVGRSGSRVGLSALARLLELLVEELPGVPGLLHGALELLVELALLAAHAAHEVVEVLRRGLLLVHPDDAARLGIDLQERLAAGAGDVERFRHVQIVARAPRA